jgi:hypothetical protein
MGLFKLLEQRISAQQFQSPNGALRRQQWTAPATASATYVHAAVTLGVAAQDVNTSITNPDFPRNVTVKGNASGIAGNCVITGTNIRGETITETIALSGVSEVAGNKAFKTVTNVNMPAKTNSSGDTVSVGMGVKFGLDRKMAEASVIDAYADGVRETTAATVAFSSSLISSNTITTNTAPNASRNFSVYFATTDVTEASGTTA